VLSTPRVLGATHRPPNNSPLRPANHPPRLDRPLAPSSPASCRARRPNLNTCPHRPRSDPEQTFSRASQVFNRSQARSRGLAATFCASISALKSASHSESPHCSSLMPSGVFTDLDLLVAHSAPVSLTAARARWTARGRPDAVPPRMAVPLPIACNPVLACHSSGHRRASAQASTAHHSPAPSGHATHGMLPPRSVASPHRPGRARLVHPLKHLPASSETWGGEAFAKSSMNRTYPLPGTGPTHTLVPPSEIGWWSTSIFTSWTGSLMHLKRGDCPSDQ